MVSRLISKLAARVATGERTEAQVRATLWGALDAIGGEFTSADVLPLLDQKDDVSVRLAGMLDQDSTGGFAALLQHRRKLVNDMGV